MPPQANQLHKYQGTKTTRPKPQYPEASSMQHGVQKANNNNDNNHNSSNDGNDDNNSKHMIQPTSADAIRIRDNQRRSRARRKEYQQDLERRVHKFEQQGVHATIEVQAAARKVARENTLLRSLLRLKGVTAGEIDQYISNAKGNESGEDVHVNANSNANGNGSGNLNRNNDRHGTGIGYAQSQPAASPISTSSSTSALTPTSTAAVFPNTLNQNQNEGQNENQPPIQLDNYPSYYPAEQTHHLQPNCGHNLPVSASAATSISTSSSSLYSPTTSFTSASLSPPANNDQQSHPQHSYTSYPTLMPYAAARYNQGSPQQDHQQPQQPQLQQHQQPQLQQQHPHPHQLPLQLHPPIPSAHPHPYRPSPSHPIHRTQHQNAQSLLHNTQSPQAPCASSTDTTLDATSCEVAASIIAGMRGHGDADSVRAELGCAPGGAPCQVGNMEIFKVLDRSIGSCR